MQIVLYVFWLPFLVLFSPLRAYAYAEIGGIDRPHKCGTGVETMYFSFVIDSPREFGSGNES